MYLLRATAVWLVIVAVESAHGILREWFLAPLVGDFRARQLAVFTGSLLILGATCLFERWMRAGTTGRLCWWCEAVVYALICEVGDRSNSCPHPFTNEAQLFRGR